MEMYEKKNQSIAISIWSLFLVIAMCSTRRTESTTTEAPVTPACVCDPVHYGDNCTNACDCGVGAQRCDRVTGCVCKHGWIGSKCNVDQNECAAANACPFNNTVCINTPGSYQCGCKTGFKREDTHCVDINECVESNDCEQICFNTAGSYDCSCNSGYVQNGKECTACSNNKYGNDCKKPCNCSTTNALVSTQTCNHVDGMCLCKDQWKGPTCNTDVNECRLGTHNCSTDRRKFCHNTHGGFECSCLIGFKEGTDGVCVQDVTTTTTFAPMQDGIDILIKINIPIEKVYHLNYAVKATFDEWAIKLSESIMAYYGKTMGSKLKKVLVHSILIGSLNVNATLIKEDSTEASQIFTRATHDLNNATLVLDNESYQASLVEVGGVTIDITKQANDQMCAIYLSDHGQCNTNYVCVVVDWTPSCQPFTAENGSEWVNRLIIGIPLFIVGLAVTVFILCKIRGKKFSAEDNERPDRSKEDEEETYNTVCDRDLGTRTSQLGIGHHEVCNMEARANTTFNGFTLQETLGDIHVQYNQRRWQQATEGTYQTLSPISRGLEEYETISTACR